MNWVFEGQIVGLIRRATWENCHAFEDEEAHELIFQTTTLIYEVALVTKTLHSPVSDFLTSSANISLHRDEQEVRGCSGLFLFMRHTTWPLFANYATSTKDLNHWKIKNVPVHSKQKEKPKKVFFLPNNLHIPNELGLNIFLIGMGLRAHYFLLHKLGLNAQTSSPDELALRLLSNIFAKHVLNEIRLQAHNLLPH